ncbi:MAG: hypothetical protein ACTSSJ_06660 [Candidatus Odinarchaeia archaeon]
MTEGERIWSAGHSVAVWIIAFIILISLSFVPMPNKWVNLFTVELLF